MQKNHLINFIHVHEARIPNQDYKEGHNKEYKDTGIIGLEQSQYKDSPKKGDTDSQYRIRTTRKGVERQTDIICIDFFVMSFLTS